MYFEECPKIYVSDETYCKRFVESKLSEKGLCEQMDPNNNCNECNGLLVYLCIDTRENMDRRYETEKRFALEKVERTLRKAENVDTV